MINLPQRTSNLSKKGMGILETIPLLIWMLYKKIGRNVLCQMKKKWRKMLYKVIEKWYRKRISLFFMI